MGQFSRSGRAANLFDDEAFFPLRKFLPHPKQVIDLTLDSDGDNDDDDDDNDAIKIASTLSPNSLRFSPSSLRKSPVHTADDLTTCTTVATPGRKLYPFKNVPRWSKLYDKFQQQAVHAGTDSLEPTSTDSKRLPKNSSGPSVGEPENSPEIPETPAVALESMRRGGDDHSDDPEVDQGSSLNEYDTDSVETDNLQSTDQTEPIASTYSSGETHLSIARPSEQILALITVSASNLSDAGEDGPARIDVSKLTTVKVLDKRSSLSGVGVEYKCEFEPLWLAADLAERVQMGGVHIQSYENGLVRDRRLKTLRVGKRKFSEM